MLLTPLEVNLKFMLLPVLQCNDWAQVPIIVFSFDLKQFRISRGGVNIANIPMLSTKFTRTPAPSPSKRPAPSPSRTKTPWNPYLQVLTVAAVHLSQLLSLSPWQTVTFACKL